jgi:hypothetical protein
MNKAKFLIEAVDNGFIVRVREYGLSALKEPYTKGIHVFENWQGVIDFCSDVLGFERLK